MEREKRQRAKSEAREHERKETGSEWEMVRERVREEQGTNGTLMLSEEWHDTKNMCCNI